MHVMDRVARVLNKQLLLFGKFMTEFSEAIFVPVNGDFDMVANAYFER